jgi:hypothetical protein
LVACLRAGDDPLPLLAAEALMTFAAEVGPLRERIAQLELPGSLKSQMISSMQRAANEAASALYRGAEMSVRGSVAPLHVRHAYGFAMRFWNPYICRD